MTFRKAEYMIQKKHKFLIMLTAVVLLAVLLQMFHVQYRISKLSKTAYGISAVGTLSEPIEAIINGNSQYIELYSNWILLLVNLKCWPLEWNSTGRWRLFSIYCRSQLYRYGWCWTLFSHSNPSCGWLFPIIIDAVLKTNNPHSGFRYIWYIDVKRMRFLAKNKHL